MSPWDRKRYPPDWRELVAQVRARAAGRCECAGECGLHPGRRCSEVQGEPALWARGKIMLTTAHLDHDTTHNGLENLKAMCQRCHLRLDVPQHRRNAQSSRRARKRNLELELGPDPA